MLGELVYEEKNIVQAPLHLEVSSFPRGIYYFSIETEDGKYQKKVLFY
jgi:hypothetical protein